MMQEDVVATSIFEAAMQFHSSLDAGEVVSVAMDALTRFVQADSWAVFMKSEHADRLESDGSVGNPKRVSSRICKFFLSV